MVRLRDRYGAFGVAAVWVMGDRALRLFCVAPETEDLGLADWLYDALGQPPVRPKDPSATRLLGGRPPVTWITLDESLNPGPEPRAAARLPEVRARGGRDVEAIVHVLRPVTDRLLLESNGFRASGVRVRADHSAMLRLALDPPPAEARRSLAALGFDAESLATGLFDPAPPGTALLFSPLGDPEAFTYRHTTLGFLVPVGVRHTRAVDLRTEPEAIPATMRERAAGLLKELQAHFAPAGPLPPEETEQALRLAFSRVPEGCLLFVPLAAEWRQGAGGKAVQRPALALLNQTVRRAAEEFSQVRVLDGWDEAETAPDAVATARAMWRGAARIAAELARTPPPAAPLRAEPPAGPPDAAARPDPRPAAPAPWFDPAPVRRASFWARLLGRG
jgi:hypothetical protein